MSCERWKTYRLGDAFLFNPKESIPKGALAKKVAMEKLQPFTRMISGYEESPFAGGSKFKNGDTLLARITPCLENGKTAQVNILNENEVGFGSTEFIVLRERKGISDNTFVYYFTNTPWFRDTAIHSMVGSSGRQRVQQDVLENIEVALPELNEQKKIASILSSLDDKIELNNQINANLEQQAQALFKSWFVDFEPFKDGEFVESELGLIPKGWTVGCINDLIEKSISGDWGKETLTDNYDQEVYCMRGADIPEVLKGNIGKMPIRFILQKNFKSKQLVKNDLVIEISGGSPTQSTGRIALVSKQLLDRFDKAMICTNFCKALKPKENWSYFVFHLWQDLYQQNVMFSYENGTTGIKNLDISGLINNELTILPTKKIISDFNLLMNQISSIIFNIGLQNEKIAKTRDTLLPKLMSGDIEV